MIELKVHIDQRPLGVLDSDVAEGLFEFRYDSVKKANRTTGFALSPRLPLTVDQAQSKRNHSHEVKVFFENLMPEGQGLDDASILYQVSKANLTGLLIHLGRDLAGAISVTTIKANEQMVPAIATNMRLVTPAELSERIRDRANKSFSVWDGKLRLSVAGYQDKIVAFEKQGSWYFVDGPALASNIILKPEPKSSAMAGMTGNEFLCMRLARLVGIEVASVRLTHLPEPVLIIERFDRITSSDFKTVKRLHVIDGCQALGLSPAMKYEKPFGVSRDVKHIRDGANLPMLFKLLTLSPQPALDRLKLLRWVIFQVLIGNTDAHAKNLSFFYGPDGLRLAPAYDLVCAPAFTSVALDDEYAMGIGDAFTLKELSPLEWAEFAHLSGLAKKLVATELARLSKRVLVELNKLGALAAENLISETMTKSIIGYIQQTCQAQLTQAVLITEVDPELLSLR